MVQTTEKTTDIQATQTPSMDYKANAIIEQIEGLFEALWNCQVHDLPDELALEVTEKVEAWKNAFYERCRCNRPDRWCNCP